MKSNILKFLSLFAVVFFAASLPAPAYAASVSSNGTGGGNWGDTAAWSGGSVPLDTDDVTIVAGDTVTLTADTTVNSLTIQSGATLNTNGFSLTVTGGLTNSGTFNAGASAVTVGGALDNGGTFNAGSSTLTLNGSFTNGGTFSAGTGTVIYGANGDQTVVSATYSNLQIDGTGWKTLNNATTATNLTVNGNLDVPGVNLTVNGATTVNGGGVLKFSNTAGTKTFNGDVLINSGGMWWESAAEAFGFAGNFTNDGTMDTDGNAATTPNQANTGVHTFSGSSKTFNGNVAIPNVTINGGSYTNNGVLKIAASLKNGASAGSLIQGNGSELHLTFGNADWTLGTFDATTNPNTVFYEKTDDQTLKLTILAYHHLVLGGSGNKIFPSDNFTVNGNLTIEGAAYSTFNVSGKKLWVKGDLTINSTYSVGPVFQIGQSEIVVDGITTIHDGKLQHNNPTGAKTYNGDFIVNAGGDFDNDGVSNAQIVPVTFNGGVTNNGTFTSGAGVLTFGGAGKTLAGTLAVTNANVTGTYTNDGNLTVTSSLTGGGTLTQGAAGTLNLGVPTVSPTLNASAAGNTVIYNRAGDQTVQPGTYHHLTLGGSGVKTAAGVTVNGVLSIEGGAASEAPTYGANATLQYNMSGTTAYTAGPEWTSPLNASGGVIIKNSRKILLNSDKVLAGNLVVQDANSKFDTGASAAANYHLTVGGDFSNNGAVNLYDSMVNIAGNFVNAGVASSAAGAQISAAGLTNYGASNGTLTLACGSTLNLTGNLDNGAGALTTSGTSSYATINLGGDYIDAGDVQVGRFNLTLNGAGAQAIAGLNTQSGTLKVNKPAGTATLTGNFGAPSTETTANRGPLEINSGSLNLGAGFTHKFSSWTMTGGLLSGGSSAVYFSGTTTPGAGVLDPESGTIRYDGNSNQPILGLTYYKLEVYRFSGTTAYTKALSGSVVVQDSLTIGTGITLGVGAFNIEVDGPTTINGKLAHTSNLGSKLYQGLVTVAGTWDNTANAPVTFRGGLTVDGTFTGGTTAVYTFDTNNQTIGGAKAVTMNTVTVNGITLTNNLANGLTVTNLNGTGGLTQAAGAVLNISGASTIAAFDASANPNTVNYTGAAAQTATPGVYHHLGLSGAGAKTLTGVSTINGNLTLTTSAAATGANLNIGGNLVVNSGTFTVGDHDMTVNGTTTVNGSLVHAGALGTKTYAGMVTIGGTGGKWTNSANVNIHLRGGLTNNSSATGSFTSGAGVYYFETNNQTIGGSKAIAIYNLDIAVGVTVTNNNAAGLTLAGGSLTGGGTLAQGATGVLNVQFADIGATGVTIDASAAGNTVNYNLAGAQTVKQSTYHNLTFAGSGTKTIPAGTTVNGNFIINGTAAVNLNDDLSVPGNLNLNAASNVGALNIGAHTLTVGGNWTRGTYGTFTGTGTVVFNGAAQQTINGVTTFPNLTVNNTGAGLLVKGNTAVSGSLNLMDGVVTGSASTIVITVNANGALSGGNDGSYIYVAQLKKLFNAGANQTFKFAVGDRNGYRPLTLSQMNVTTAGFIIATVPDTPAEHAAASTSGINTLKNVNRYWRLATGGGFLSSALQAEFGFQNAHMDAGANPAAFMVRKYQTTPSTTPPWFVPALVDYARDSTADPMMSVSVLNGFATLGASSDFVVGELPPTGLTVSAINAAYGDTVTLSATLLSNGLPVAGRTVDFNFNGGASVGSAVTNASGVATLSGVPLKVNAGEYLAPGNGVMATFAGDITYSPSVGSANLTVAKRPLTVSSVADTKEFDGTDSSDETPVITSGSLVSGDTAGTWTQKFNNMGIGTGKEMQIVSLPINDGNGGNNYEITTLHVSNGEIAKRTLTITGGLTAFSRLYDGTNVVTVTPGVITFDGVLPGYPNVGISVTNGVFADKHVGVDKPVAASGTLSGTDAGYYRLNSAAVSGLTATIYPYSAAGCADYNAAIDPDISCPPAQAFIGSLEAVSGGADKNYDGTTASAILPTCNTGSDCAPLLFSGDSVSQTFNSKDAGSRTLTPYLNDGNNGANYGSPTQNTASATISPAALTITADNKVAYVNKTLPAFTYSVTGFVAGESFLTPGFTEPTCAPSAPVDLTRAGSYTIVCSGANAGGNYAISYVNAILQVVFPRSAVYKPLVPLQDGWILSSSVLNTAGGSFGRTGNLYVGDNVANRQYRALLSFATDLPAGAVIDSVVLKLKRAGLLGRDPFVTHGSLYVNMSIPNFGDTPYLENADFEAIPSFGTVAGAFGRSPDASGWYSASLTNSAQAAMPLNGDVQFRLRFTRPTDMDNVADILQFYGGEALANYQPQLIIGYYVPTP